MTPGPLGTVAISRIRSHLTGITLGPEERFESWTEELAALREGARALYRALGAGRDDDRSKKRGAPESAADPSQMTPEEEVLSALESI
jgi:hypothetical protein